MSANKYCKAAITIDGREVERHKVVFRPAENEYGVQRTSDGKLYKRMPDGSLRRLR
jgi:hypothetical protein